MSVITPDMQRIEQYVNGICLALQSSQPSQIDYSLSRRSMNHVHFCTDLYKMNISQS